MWLYLLLPRNYDNVPRGRFQRDQYNYTDIYTLMKKLQNKAMQQTRMYNPAQHGELREINVGSSTLSRVKSALHRDDVTAVVGFLASKKGRCVDEYANSVAITTRRPLSSQQPRRNSRWNDCDTASVVSPAMGHWGTWPPRLPTLRANYPSIV